MNIRTEPSFGEITSEDQCLVMNLGSTIDYKNFINKMPGVFLNITNQEQVKQFFKTPINVNRYISSGTKKIIKDTIYQLILSAKILKDKKKEKIYNIALNELNKCKVLENHQPIKINDLIVTPFMNSEDSYLLLIESKDNTLLWAGYYKGNDSSLLGRVKSILSNREIDYIVINKQTYIREHKMISELKPNKILYL